MSDSSLPHGLQPTRSSVHGIFQARVLEWGAIAFSILSYYNILNGMSLGLGSHESLAEPVGQNMDYLTFLTF